MSDIDRVKKTIRELLNLANDDGAFEQEAENALRFARKLMNRHGLDQADLEEERDATSVAAAADVEYGIKHTFSESSTLSHWEMTLAGTVCKLFGTIDYYVETKQKKTTKHGTLRFNERTGKPLTGTKMNFYGPEGDCAQAIEILDEWRMVVMSMARLKYGGVFKGPGRSYCEGFARSLWEKFRTIESEETRAIANREQDRSGALMLINSKAIQIAKKERGKNWLKDVKGIKLRARPSTSYRQHHAGAFQDGREDGKRADLSASKRKRLG